MIKKNFFLKFTLTFLFFILFLYYSLNSAIHTDELWTYSESVLFKRGYMPYSEFFSHRLPMSLFVSYPWLSLFGEGYFNLRLLCVVISTISIYLFLDLIEKIFLKNIIIIFSFLILLHKYYFDAQSLLLNMAIFNFFLVLTLRLIFFTNSFNIKKINIFFFLQGLIFLSRYIVDIQTVLIFSYLFFILGYLFIFHKNKFNKNIKYILPCAIFIPFVTIYVSLFLEDKIFYDVVTYNLNQSSLMRELIFTKYDVSIIKKFLILRYLEFKEFLAVILFFILSFIFYIKKIFHLLKKENNYINNFKNIIINEKLFLFCLVFIISYYLFYTVTLNDYPITKIYLIYPTIIIICNFLNDCLTKLKNKKIIIISVFICTILIQNLKTINVFKFHNINHYQNIVELNINIMRDFDFDNNKDIFLTFNPLLFRYFNVEKNKSMELFSLLHNLNPNEAKYYNLAHKSTIIENIKNKKYRFIILEEKRIFSGKHMSRILDKNFIIDLKKQIKLNYFFHSIYPGIASRGNFIVYYNK
tara:strand:+ start:3926 stop:5503 length:1578 start_codon:yes stop_codon:yes gene_type:complete